MSMFQKQKRTTLTEMALKEIRNAIQSRKLRPGDRIIEAELARQMGISRFPIREAIRCLEREGVVKTIPFEGTHVSRFDLNDLEELYTLRSALEELAIRILMKKMTPRDIEKLESVLHAMEKAVYEKKEGAQAEDMRFHQTICELAGHRRLLETWLTLQDQLRSFIAIEEESYRGGDQLLKVHYPLMEAIKSGDSLTAEQCIRDHIAEALEIIRGVLQSENGDREENRGKHVGL